MHVRVLGSAGAEFPDFRPPAFLIDGQVLLDAGTVGGVLSEEEQWGIRHILITHSHLDHIRAIPALADNIIIKNLHHTVHLHSIEDVISAMRSHMFNDIIWPDFTRIPSTEAPVITYVPVEPRKEFRINGYSVLAIPVNHTVPTVGYRVTSHARTIVYTGDTGPTGEIWDYSSDVDALIVEVSFPNEMEQLAVVTRHLTASMLVKELDKIKVLPKRILITHPKPQYYAVIQKEIREIGIPAMELLHDGSEYNI